MSESAFASFFIKMLDVLLESMHPVVVAVLVGSLAFHLLSGFIVRHRYWNPAARDIWNDALAESIGPPLKALVWIIGLNMAVKVSGFGNNETIDSLAGDIQRLGAIATCAWFMVRFLDRAKTSLVEAGGLIGGQQVDEITVAAVRRLLRLTVVIVATLMILQTLGFGITGILAFGGIGAAAVGLAAKDLLSNLFGSLMLYIDRPFKKGDWVRSPDRALEGVVESVNWRVTCIHSLDNRPLYVPNAVFTTIVVENLSRTASWRIHETVTIRHDGDTALEGILDGVRAGLMKRDDIDPDQTLVVSFTRFASSSLDLLVSCATKAVSGAGYLKIRQEVMMRVIEIVQDAGAECVAAPATETVAAVAPSVHPPASPPPQSP